MAAWDALAGPLASVRRAEAIAALQAIGIQA